MCVCGLRSGLRTREGTQQESFVSFPSPHHWGSLRHGAERSCGRKSQPRQNVRHHPAGRCSRRPERGEAREKVRHRAEGQRARNGTMRQGDVSLVDVAAREESRRAADIGRKRREGEKGREGGERGRRTGGEQKKERGEKTLLPSPL